MNKNSFSYSEFQSDSLPNFGFKIHISATWKNYQKIKKQLIPILEREKVSYKYLKNDEEVWFNFSSQESMAESGKFFTIYPENQGHFLHILDLLYKELDKDLDGIYIMSDRPYKDSKIIFYRYGTICLDVSQTKDGLPTVYGPNGEEWKDYQRTYFELPSWIEDIQPSDIIEESYLSANYVIDYIKKTNNGGNIYQGKHLSSGQEIIMKESRPRVLALEDVEMAELRENEYVMTKRFDRFVPKVIEKVQEWQHTYYIYEKISGESLRDYAQKLTVFSYQSTTLDDLKNNVKKFRQFLDIVEKLLTLVHYFHQQDVILHDISPDNFMVDAQGKIYFIDLEHAYCLQRGIKTGVYHEVALKSWNELSGKEADCKKLGNLLLYLLARLQLTSDNHFELMDNLEVLEHLLERYGIDSKISNLINYLFQAVANVEVAQHIVNHLKSELKASQALFELHLPDMITEEKIDFIQRLKSINLTLPKYRQALSDESLFCYHMATEPRFGLDGLLGSLILLKNKLSEELFNQGLDYIRRQIVETDSGSALSIGNNCASPYFSNGSAGYIRALLYLDIDYYREEIISLAQSFNFEFAQRADYDNGMLGIADCLLELYNWKMDRAYLDLARKLLLNTSFYVKVDKVSVSDFLAVANKYEELTHDSITSEK